MVEAAKGDHIVLCVPSPGSNGSDMVRITGRESPARATLLLPDLLKQL